MPAAEVTNAFDYSAVLCDIDARLTKMNAELDEVLPAFLRFALSKRAAQKVAPGAKASQKRRREDSNAEN